jgi:NAD(P)H-dependent FMN reductase
MRTTLYEGLGTLLHFNPDNDPDGGPVPAAVADLRRRLAEADAVPFCAPEHAGSLPGSFKNPLDWTVDVRQAGHLDQSVQLPGPGRRQ